MLSEIQVGSTITGTAGESYTGFTAEITEISEYPADKSDYYYFGGDSNPNVSYYPFLAYIDDAEGLSNNEWADLTIETNQEKTIAAAFIWTNAMYVLKMARVMYTRQEPEISWKNNM